jgi:hypothetical protein
MTTESLIESALSAQGFAHVSAPGMAHVLARQGFCGWPGFAASWNDLSVDSYMADGGRYRRRRHAVFSANASGIRRKAHQPHYQSRDYNPLNGGIERWFEPLHDDIATHPALRAILQTCQRMFDNCTPEHICPVSWHVEVHQFRVEARAGEAGQPTPEGMHRDGVDWVLVMLVRRENVASGETTIFDLSRTPLGSFTLTEPMEAALVDDGRVYHGVTPIVPLDPAAPAFRDVLVVTFRHE